MVLICRESDGYMNRQKQKYCLTETDTQKYKLRYNLTVKDTLRHRKICNGLQLSNLTPIKSVRSLNS